MRWRNISASRSNEVNQRPNFAFYGWRVSSALAVTTLVSYGVLFYTFGVITKPMEAEFGWTRSQTSIAMSLATLTNGLSAVFVGRVVDRHGARWIGAIGSVFGAALLLAWSDVGSLVGLYVVFTLMGFAWSAVFYEVAFAAIATWFRHDRARATFLITMVAGFASTIFIPLTTYLVEAHGWRPALRVLAVALVLLTFPLHAVVVRKDPASLSLQVDGRVSVESLGNESSVSAAVARSSAVFWRMAIAFGLARFFASAIGSHTVPMLREAGHSASFAAVVAGSIGPIQVLGRVIFLPLSSRVRLRTLSVLTFAMFFFGFVSLWLAVAGVGVVLFVACYGAANGAVTMSRATMTAEQFGPAAYGQISGSIALIGSVMAAVAPYGAGWVRTTTGDYRWVVGTLAIGALIGGFVIAPIDGATLTPDTREAHEGRGRRRQRRTTPEQNASTTSRTRRRRCRYRDE